MARAAEGAEGSPTMLAYKQCSSPRQSQRRKNHKSRDPAPSGLVEGPGAFAVQEGKRKRKTTARPPVVTLRQTGGGLAVPFLLCLQLLPRPALPAAMRVTARDP